MNLTVKLLGYVDPSSGSLAVQFLIAAVLSAGVVMRNYVLWPVTWAMRWLRGNAPQSARTSAQATVNDASN